MKCEGLIKTCDHCGKKIFIEKNDSAVNDNFVEVTVSLRTRFGYGDEEVTNDLCQKCSSEFTTLYHEFFDDNA